jgi:membrane protein required for colicin V production
MNFIDMFMLVLLAYAVFKGLVRGFVMQIASLAALILGIYGALKLSGFTSRYLARFFSLDFDYIYLIAVSITFIIVFILIHLIGRALESMIETAQLSLPNKIFGVIFSVFKVILIVGVLLLFIDRVDRRAPLLPKNARENSIFYKPVTSFARFLFPSLAGPDYSRDIKIEEFV